MTTSPRSATRKTPADAAAILRSLAIVEAERTRRAGDARLAARVPPVKAFQQARFEATHADLLQSARYRDAARFFLDELYGPEDFTRRDAQFARIVPALVRLFPQGIVDTVATLAELHALSEELDTAMALALPADGLDADGYVAAWRAVGRRADRERQIALVMDVGHALDRITRAPMLVASLKLMRGPARAAGLSELQSFLERGLDTFRAMGGAGEFMQRIEARERTLLDRLFDAGVAQATVAAGLPQGG
ncbi:MAG TPA: hypothetical protein VFR90_07665 [Methylibium sp.]|uniref:FFLEELY motif protein n=1 Tax=Methylibium sp. TaxID=2067992 RepID=UPI002DBF7B20|nr:hypothetical protein [Methylibium sp.]HEU4458984.1 hypothetical protein [Methylibium sp.]